jgi:hypothetical protein
MNKHIHPTFEVVLVRSHDHRCAWDVTRSHFVTAIAQLVGHTVSSAEILGGRFRSQMPLRAVLRDDVELSREFIVRKYKAVFESRQLVLVRAFQLVAFPAALLQTLCNFVARTLVLEVELVSLRDHPGNESGVQTWNARARRRRRRCGLGVGPRTKADGRGAAAVMRGHICSFNFDRDG